MGMRRKALVILAVMVFFFLGFTLTGNTSATEDIIALKYVVDHHISYIEIITHKTIESLTVQALNKEGEVTHFLILEDYVVKKFPDKNKNIFYITNKVHGLDAIDELILISSGNIKVPVINYEVQQQETLDTLVYMPEEKDEGNVDTLKIMSYNIHHGRDLYGRYSLDRIVEVIRESGADIVGIQEAENGVIRSRYKDQMKYLSEELSMYYVYGDNINLLGGKYGNGILSKYPIESYENLHLPSGRERRGVLRATINANGRRINLLNTHLGLNHQERIKQMNAINSYLDTLPHEVILLGDFNARPDNKIITNISKRLVDVGYATDQGDLPTFDVPVLAARIDYIFLDQAFKVKDYEVIKSRASDHYPVLTTIGIPEL